MHFISLIITSAIIYIFITFSQPTVAPLHIDFLNCGQGDSILVTLPENITFLVDTCPDGTITSNEIKKHMPLLKDTLDIVILTHPDSDHIAGLPEIMNNFKIGTLITPSHTIENLSKSMHSELARKHIPVIPANADHDIMIGNSLLDIIYPSEGSVPPVINDNNTSLVMKIISEGHTILLTGDMEEPLEHMLIEQGFDLSAEILKGGHHGSKSSTSEEFLNSVKPVVVIFQNGLHNKYGHPNPEILARISNKNIPVYNTSIHGNIHVDCMREKPCSIISENLYEQSFP